MGLGSTSWVLRQLGLTASGRHPTLEGFHLFEALWDRESGYHSLRPYDNWGNYAKQDRGCWGRVAFPSPGVHIVPVYYFVYTGVGTPLYHSGGWSWQMGRASNNHFGTQLLHHQTLGKIGRTENLRPPGTREGWEPAEVQSSPGCHPQSTTSCLCSQSQGPVLLDHCLSSRRSWPRETPQ